MCKTRSEPSGGKSITGVTTLPRLNEGAAVRALIFDLDGVIVDSEPNQFEAFSRALAPYGFRLHFEYFTRRMIGVSPRESLALLCNDFGLSFDIATVAASKDRFYEEIAAKDPRANSLVVKLVHRLKQCFPIALASGTPSTNVKVILRTLNLTGIFDAVVSGDDVSHGKPDPEIFLLAARRLSVSPTSCVVFEASLPGVEAARRSGMRMIAIRSEYTSAFDFSEANLVIENVKVLDVGKLAKLLIEGGL